MMMFYKAGDKKLDRKVVTVGSDKEKLNGFYSVVNTGEGERLVISKEKNKLWARRDIQHQIGNKDVQLQVLPLR